VQLNFINFIKLVIEALKHEVAAFQVFVFIFAQNFVRSFFLFRKLNIFLEKPIIL